MSKEQKESFMIRFLSFCVKAPVTLFFVCVLGYFAFQTYVLGDSPFINKVIMLCLLILWAIWFLARHMIKVLIVVCVVGAVAYGYYAHTRQKIESCENSGGVWNEQTQTCEVKKSFLEEVKDLWYQYFPQEDEKEEKSAETTK